jgi:hypothetical protein
VTKRLSANYPRLPLFLFAYLESFFQHLKCCCGVPETASHSFLQFVGFGCELFVGQSDV